jgi:hypothetical protein
MGMLRVSHGMRLSTREQGAVFYAEFEGELRLKGKGADAWLI